MQESIYLLGQISADEKETYLWRKRVRDHFQRDIGVEIIDPCFNAFNQSILDDGKGDPQRLKIYKMQGTSLLVPKDYSYVLRSSIGLANLNTYDPKKPIIGTFFELAWYFADPEKTVIGIFNGDPTKDVVGNHPFVRSAVTTWVKNEQEGIELIERYFQDIA